VTDKFRAQRDDHVSTSANPGSLEEARRTFFVETEGAADAFVLAGWRGAVLYRDQYDLHAMPPALWDALREAGGDSDWSIFGDALLGKSQPTTATFTSDWGWDSFSESAANPAGNSIEWMAYNRSQTIAVLAEYDVTIVGACREAADDIDRILQASGTSLRQLTFADYSEPDRLAGFIRAVTK
jgi:hypothetical protein